MTTLDRGRHVAEDAPCPPEVDEFLRGLVVGVAGACIVIAIVTGLILGGLR